MIPEHSRMLQRILFTSVWISLVFLIPGVTAGNVTNGTDILNATVTQSEYYITIDPVGNHTGGEVFFLNGTTNLPTSDTLSILIIRRWQNSGSVGSVFESTIPIQPGNNNVNSWSCNISPSTLWTTYTRQIGPTHNVKNFRSDTYIAEVKSKKFNVSSISQNFNIISAESNAPILSSLIENFSTSYTTPSLLNQTITNINSTTPKSAIPIPITLPLLAVVVGVAILQIVRMNKKV